MGLFPFELLPKSTSESFRELKPYSAVSTRAPPCILLHMNSYTRVVSAVFLHELRNGGC